MARQQHKTTEDALLTSWRAVAGRGRGSQEDRALPDSVCSSSCEGELVASSREYSEVESLVWQLESGRGSSTSFSGTKWGCRLGGCGGASGCLVCVNVVQ